MYFIIDGHEKSTHDRDYTFSSPSSPSPSPSPSPHDCSGFCAACIFTLLLYSARLDRKSLNGSSCAGSLMLGSSRRSWIPSRICFTVMDGFQSLSSDSMDRHTVPDG